MTEMESYFTQILDGKIVACEKMKKISEILLNKLYNPGEFHFDPAIAARHTDFIEKFCKLPSGQANTPLKLELFQKARLQAVFGFVDDNDLRQYREVFIVEGRKNGKGFSLDTEIPTPEGYRKMGDIHRGDVVFSCDGTPAEVTLESEIFMKPMYEVEFEDGTTVKASMDHLWTVCSRNSKRRYRESRAATPWEVVDTESMVSNYVRERADGKGREYYYRVPMSLPVAYSKKNLPVDPYLLGQWLGDGCSDTARLTCHEDDYPEILPRLQKSGYQIHAVKAKSKPKDYKGLSVYINRGAKEKSFTAELKELGVLQNKRIPRIYMEASIEQRLELLKGLMDSDGYCDKAGQVEFSQKSKHLAYQVQELVSSLGIKAGVHEKEAFIYEKSCGLVYRVFFFTTKEKTCFHLKRKTERLKDKLADRMLAKSIVRITPIDTVPSKCIGIDHPSHMYLFGRTYSVTHNTTETAAVELDLLINDGEFSPQVYNCANKLDQSKLGFNACHKMVKQSPLLSKYVRKRAADLYFEKNYGFIKALAAEQNTMDGLDIHGACIDEMAAMKSRAIYDLIVQGTSARKQSLIFTISTNGFVRDSIFDQQMAYSADLLEGRIKNDRFLPFIYELDDLSEWDNEDMWIKSNPGIDAIKSRDTLRTFVQKAKDDVAFKPTVLIKDFNMPQTGSTSWLRWEDLDNKAMTPEDAKFRYAIFALDAADTTDLNAAKAICMRPDDPHIYVKSMYWLPQRVLDEFQNQGKLQGRDNVPYQLWKDKGLLRTVDTYKVDKHVILDWFKELVEDDDIYPMYIGYDPWHIDDSLLRDFENEFGKNTMIPVRQGVATLSGPMKELKADLQNKLVVYNNNPIDKWCLANTAVKADINANIQPVKTDDPRRRIDGTLALIDAYVVFLDKKDEYLAMI